MIVRARFHGRGGQGAKTASRILGDAAFDDGFNVQDFPLYGAERRGAPVTAFTRFSDSEITERGYIFNPDVVVVMDESLLDDELANPLGGLRLGGVVVANTSKPGREVCPDRADAQVVAVDLTSMALETLGKPVLSAAVAAAAARVASITEGSLLSAVAAELREIGLSKETVSKNINLAKSVYSSLRPLDLKTKPLDTKERLVPMALVVREDGSEDILASGNSGLRRTGNWRTFRPVIDYDRCTDCLICYAYCPESSLSLGADGRVHIDYDNCKGCMICMTECPPKAIAQQREAAMP